MQSVSALHVVLQAVGPQTYGLQAVVTGAGQAPAPSQFAAAVAVPLEQLADLQLVVLLGYVHAAVFVPSQLPPQSEPSLLQAVREPCGVPVTATQVPTEPETSQAWHWPPHAVLQQTPSTQLPLPHWFAAVQAPPFPILGVHAPALQ
jgi:hypothetical protein